MKVHKFGGSILKNENDILKIKDLILSLKEPSIFVFSAFYGVTDKLIEILKLSKKRSSELTSKIEEIVTFHKDLCQKLDVSLNHVNYYLNQIKDISHSVLTLGHYSSKISDSLLVFGELLSSKIIFHYISKFTEIEYLDSRNLIKTDSNFSSAKVDFINTEKLVISEIKNNLKYIVSGFIGSNKENESTTLGRNGSDYTAAVLAALLSAKDLIIWKDVDGVFSADPKIVKDSTFIDKISYKEMIELSYFGNKVIAFKALDPAIKNLISIKVRNLYNKNNNGSIISKETNEKFQIKGITKLDDIVVLIINSDKNRINGNLFYRKVFDIFFVNKIEPIFFTKSSSDVNFTVGLKNCEYLQVVDILKNEFTYEIEKNIISVDSKNLSIVSVIGFDMTKIPGIIYKISNLLNKQNITIPIIIDSLSDYSISIGVNQNNSERVVQLLHSSFFDKR